MSEKICPSGHVLDPGRDACSRCGGRPPEVLEDAPKADEPKEEGAESKSEAAPEEQPKKPRKPRAQAQEVATGAVP